MTHYRIRGHLVNSTCSADERSPLYNQSCTFYFDYSNCTTISDVCEVPNLRRATFYLISAAAVNMMGEGPNMTTAGYPEVLMLVHPGRPEPPDSPPVVSNIGRHTVHLSWGKSPDNGGAPVNGWAIYAHATPAPPKPPSTNPTPPVMPVLYVKGVGVTSFTIGVDQAYDVNWNPITVQLNRYTNYTFRVAATNRCHLCSRP